MHCHCINELINNYYYIITIIIRDALLLRRPYRNMPTVLPHSSQMVPTYHPGFTPVHYQTTPFQKQQHQVDDGMMVPSMHALGHQQMQQNPVGVHGMHFESTPFDQVSRTLLLSLLSLLLYY